MSSLPWLYGAHIFCPTISLCVLPSAGRYLPLFFCNQKKSRKTVKEKFRPLPSRSRVRLPPKGGINAPPETVWFLISTASPMGSRAVFQFPSDARPPEVLRTSRGYYFDNSAKEAHSARRLSRGWCGEGSRAAPPSQRGRLSGSAAPRAALPRNRKIYFSFLWLFAPRIFSGRRGKISPKGSFEKVVIK